ncbi:MAG: alkaline phosphatase family protein [Candidatus Aenigmarchaeota archaeon]|nr:alkaline phosphatase family protein [Candidatus Aenigmarchaeota archaeon]
MGEVTAVSQKLFIIGIEGASYDLIVSLMKEDKLPNLSKLLKDGKVLNLTSELPLVSPVTWTSFATGVNPGRHGIFGWQQCDPYTYETYIPLSSDIKEKTFWRILSEHGKKAIIINMYLTYPPEEVNGTIISGMPSPHLAAYPKSLEDELEKEGYKLEAKGYVDTPKDEFLSDLYDTTEKRARTALKLMRSEKWDLFFVLFTGIDRIQHYLWKDMEKNSKYGEEIPRYYQFIDEKIGELIGQAGDIPILIVSDHGFRRVEKRFHLNHWLIEEGYLKLKPTPKNFVKTLLLKTSTFIKKIRLNDLFLNLFKKLGKKPSETMVLNFDIDYEKTKAFTCAFYEPGIYINKRMNEDLREKLINEITQKLKKVKDPESDVPIFKEIRRSSEIYDGSFTDLSPDILLVTEKNYSAVGGFTFSGLLESNLKETGTHEYGGFMILKGLRPKSKNASLEDIATSILSFFGIKAEHSDGVPGFTPIFEK